MLNLKEIFKEKEVLFLFFFAGVCLAAGFLIHPVLKPCPQISEGSIAYHDTLMILLRDTVYVPRVEFRTKFDTVYQIPETNIFLSTKSYEDSVASVEARVWAPCKPDSIGLNVSVRPIIIERTKEIIVTDTVKTVKVIEKTSFGKKLTYTGLGILIGAAAILGIDYYDNNKN